MGLVGKKGLSADIAIIQAATIAVFISFSANARSLILSSNDNEHEANLWSFRLLLLLPISGLAYYLSVIIVDVPALLAIGLIIRKATEWFAELQLASKEKQHDVTFALTYAVINSISLLLLIITMLLLGYDAFIYGLFLWALLPLLFLKDYAQNLKQSPKLKGLARYVSHVGSTAVIGFSTYLFRVLIYLLVGKVVAGSFFTAYAIGGVISSLYIYAIGPTIIHRNTSGALKVVLKYALTVTLTGIMLIVIAAANESLLVSSNNMMRAIGISLIGGGVMLIAQHYRLHFIQVYKRDVFVPDALANMLLIFSVPFSFFLFNESAFYYLFLWAAILNLSFYYALSLKSDISGVA